MRQGKGRKPRVGSISHVRDASMSHDKVVSMTTLYLYGCFAFLLTLHLSPSSGPETGECIHARVNLQINTALCRYCRLQLRLSMGCGASKNSGAAGGEAAGQPAASGARKQSIVAAVEVPDIKVVSGEAVKLTAFPRVIFIFGIVIVKVLHNTVCTHWLQKH